MNLKMLVGLMLCTTVLCLTPRMANAVPPSLEERVAALETAVATLQSTVSTLQTLVAALQSNNVLALSPYLTVDTTNHVALFHGVNVQLVNGTGYTGAVNGLGNLIIGYDLIRDDGIYFCSDGAYLEESTCKAANGTWSVSHKTGSHYLVVGDSNNYSQYGGLVVGISNTSNAPYASVSGGAANTASGAAASVSGGYVNTASGFYASVSGGVLNGATGPYASVSGGVLNGASGYYTSVSGGQGNAASGSAASVSGGYQRTGAIGDFNWVAGGLFQAY